ncbi:response regulator transcription factor [Paradesertivirga mongoliensis]|uniref:Response regulator transcription factor n=1 Tax=Paradesertivirga mongoliensis TaxID=2100740 RepID=A0ABW4ZG34_9SPHI|nr:response regulator [Pedobacter mongoliensis]
MSSTLALTMASVTQKILIVDDEPDIRDLLSHCLKKVGYSVDTAANGQDGIFAAIQFRPHLIIMDLMMPVMGGLEACSILRNMVDFRNTFIIFLTARNDEQSEVKALDSGADDYIVKPVKPQVIVNRINAILRREIRK